MEKNYEALYDIVVIGGGSAGLAAAISSYDSGIKNVLLLEKEAYLGGILNQCVHNGFGLHTFKEELTGPEYAERFIDELKKRDIEVRLEATVLEITKDKEIEYSDTLGYHKIKAKAIICACGCSERTRGQIRTPGDRCSGVMTAGLAQRYLNVEGYLVGKKVFILGSGDIGLIMARRMTLEGAKVLGVAELMPYSNGLNRNIVQCLNDFNIPLYLSHTVKRIIGKNRLEKIVICEVDDKLNFVPGTDKEFEVDTLLLSVGLIPYNPLLEKIGVAMHPKTRGPLVDSDYQTSIPGIFACGNGLHVHDLVDFVTNESKKVGECAAKYVLENGFDASKVLTVTPLNGIGYILPGKVYLKDEGTIKFNFRVNKPFKDVSIIAKLNGEEIKRTKKPYLLPAEMVEYILDMKLLKEGELTLEVSND